MRNNGLNELVRRRQDWVKITKENGFDFDSILAGLYNDPSHFVYEILQNAEDVRANKVIFDLLEDRLDILHDGKIFDADDIDAITGIGISTKKDDVNTIGTFGVGFKSVFAVTQTPIIRSGNYHIKISDFVVPTAIDYEKTGIDTRITLPFNHKIRPRDEVFELVSSKLQHLGLRTLLFLKNIDEIQWQIPGGHGHYHKSSVFDKDFQFVRHVTIMANADGKEFVQKYLVICRDFELDSNNLTVEIAFQLGQDPDDGREVIVPVSDPRLVVYFPTERVTFLTFLVQGPYKTTPNRENIPLDDAQNQAITEEVAALVGESLLYVRDLGLLDVEFLRNMPLDDTHVEEDPIYAAIYKSIKAKLSSGERLWPTNDGGYAAADRVLLASGRPITKMFSSQDIDQLFSRNHWVSTQITYDRTRDLYDYLVDDIGVQEVDNAAVARRLDEQFLHQKSDEWFANYYSYLRNQPALWRDGKDYPYRRGPLRSKPIIRLENDIHIEPFDEDGNVQAYLPGETESQYPTVKESLLEANEEAVEFLKELGFSKPDLLAEIREFLLPKYFVEFPNVDVGAHKEDMRKLLLAYEQGSSAQRSSLIADMSDSHILKAENLNGEFKFVRSNEAYRYSEKLSSYFEGNPNIHFVSNKMYGDLFERLDDLLNSLGVADLPRRIPFKASLSYYEKIEIRAATGQSESTKDIEPVDYDLMGLEHFMEQPLNQDRSMTLWALLGQCIDDVSISKARRFFQGKYEWFYYSERSGQFKASFVKVLLKEPWLLDHEGKFLRPSDMISSELHPDYDTSSANIDLLLNVLDFKLDVIDQLPEEMRDILEVADGRSPAEVEKALALLDDQEIRDSQVDSWTPSGVVDVANTEVVVAEPMKKDPPILPDPINIGKNGSNDDGNGKDQESDVYDSTGSRADTKKAKDIGHWGEQLVFAQLKKQHSAHDTILTDKEYGCLVSYPEKRVEIHWLNIDKDKGKGCDFLIIEDGEKLQYIEVKTTEGEDEKLLQVTGLQWRLAHYLHETGMGDKYVIFRVLGAGKEQVKIKEIRNPVKLWNEGRLYAHPVNLKI